ncbi:peptidase [Streptomyces sp. WAC 01529]|uniref:Clp protease N-terminal domain-containing protein n=1 Tax=Streptomyces sp. WAC 01529 TaxID=2203205 RepID=UPI000F6DDBC7|nr:Clp protease N-terminal domain-containing protein [Streptomyces sp. WAC 01529]AZM52021.1 peptidase [Streptomyces sp. WAC 01529]
MQSRTPPGAEPDPTRAGLDSRLSAELASVVAGARRRAVRDGDRQIDTAHLLHSLLETDPEVRAVFENGAQVVRLLGYLVQRSIGYGLQWQGTVEDSGAVPVVAAHKDHKDHKEAGWSPAAVSAMDVALERAEVRGDPRALGMDLLAGLTADPECRAVEVLGRAGVDVEVLLRRVEAGCRQYAAGGHGFAGGHSSAG